VNIATRDLSYRDLDTPLTGLFCWNEAQEGPRPGILLIHGGAGLDAHAREQACRYAALAALADCPDTAGPAAAVGFCFGGMAALALARAGTNLAAVVSIHGSLATSAPAQPGAVTARILVCHGAADPHVPPADVAAFAAEMNHAGADWQLVMYGRAQHGFTHQHAVPGAMPGVAYDRLADERSFAAVRAFLAGALAP
jgi:dienelactone hydrolase